MGNIYLFMSFYDIGDAGKWRNIGCYNIIWTEN